MIVALLVAATLKSELSSCVEGTIVALVFATEQRGPIQHLLRPNICTQKNR